MDDGSLGSSPRGSFRGSVPPSRKGSVTHATKVAGSREKLADESGFLNPGGGHPIWPGNHGSGQPPGASGHTNGTTATATTGKPTTAQASGQSNRKVSPHQVHPAKQHQELSRSRKSPSPAPPLKTQQAPIMPAPQESPIISAGKVNTKEMKTDPIPVNKVSQERAQNGKHKYNIDSKSAVKTAKMDNKTNKDHHKEKVVNGKLKENIPDVKQNSNLYPAVNTTINQDKKQLLVNPVIDNKVKHDSIKEEATVPNDVINPSEDVPYYARMTIIDDCSSLDNSINDEHKDKEEEELIQDVPLKEYNRSISEPPEENKHTNINPTRKLSEGEAKNSHLTGLFFPKID